METLKTVLAFIGAACVVCATGITLLYFAFTSGVKEEIKNGESKELDVRNFN